MAMIHAVAAALLFHSAPFRVACSAGPGASSSNWKVKPIRHAAIRDRVAHEAGSSDIDHCICPFSFYLDAMTGSGLVRLLTLLVVLLTPLTMMASHASAAPVVRSHDMDASASMAGHCSPSDGERDGQPEKSNIDCTIMCSAMPTTLDAVPDRVAAPALDLVQAARIGGHGLNPAATHRRRDCPDRLLASRDAEPLNHQEH
jgi:hypothetical protein